MKERHILPAHGVEFGLAIQLITLETNSVQTRELRFVVDAAAAKRLERSLVQITADGRLDENKRTQQKR